MTTIQQIIDHIETLAPLSLQEGWDNCGVQVGYDPSTPCTGITLAVDVCPQAVQMTINSGANLLVTHHPLTIDGLKNFTQNSDTGTAIALAITHKITIYSAHTSLDSCTGGLNDFVAQKLGLQNTSPILPNPTNPNAGLGRIGTLQNPMTTEELAHLVKEKLNLTTIRHSTTNPNQKIKTVAMCTGSGESLINPAKTLGAQAYISGDLKYHAFTNHAHTGPKLLEIDHYQCEFFATQILNSHISDFFTNFTPQTLKLNPTKYI